MKPRPFSAFHRSCPLASGLILLTASAAHAVDYYKANNTSSLNQNASWVDAAGATIATTPANAAASDSDVWIWDSRVLEANAPALGNDIRVKTIRIVDPGGPVTIDGVGNNRSISVANGGGIDMSSATQDLTIRNLNTGSNVGYRLLSGSAAITINVAASRTLTLNSKIAVNGNSATSTAAVNFTGPGTTICNAQVQANRVTITAGEVRLNDPAGSARPGTAAVASTVVEAAKLVVNNTSGSATGAGPVSIASGATLSGQGIMSGSVTINNGGTIVPGDNAVGSLTAGSFTMAAGSTLKWEAVDSSQADLVNVTNADGLAIHGGTVELRDAGTANPFSGLGTFNLFSYTGSIAGAGVSSLVVAESSKIAGRTYTFGLTAGYVTLRIEVGSRPQSFWNVNADGNWATAGSWTNSAVPNAAQAIANLGGSQGTPITVPRTVNIANGATVGVLNFDSAQPFTVIGNGTLDFDDGDTAATLHVETGSHTIAAPVYLTANGLAVDVENPTGTLTLQGVVSGDGVLGKSGQGTLILKADNVYTGLTSNSAGILQLGTGGTTGSVSGPIANSGTLRINHSEEFNLFYPISGAGGLELVGPGKTSLSNPNTFSGPTTLTAGSLQIADPLALQNSTLTYATGSGTLSHADFITFLTLGGLTGDKPFPLTNSVGTPVSLTVGQNNSNTTYSGSPDGTGVAFTKAGSGTLTLTGSHAFSGAATVNGGILSLDGGSVFSAAGFNLGTVAGAKLLLNGGALQATAQSLITNESAGFEIAAGTASFAAITTDGNKSNGASFLHVTGGTLNATSLSMSRGSLNLGSEPATGQTTNGLYLSNGEVTISGAMNFGTGANSSVSGRMDKGSLTVNGATTIAINNPDRWTVFDIAGGTFTSNHAAVGVRLGGPFPGKVIMHARGGVVNAQRFQFGQPDFGGSTILNLTGGNLYLGAGGMVLGSTSNALTARLRLGGGVLGATADSVSDVPVSLTGAGVVTGADAADAPHSVVFNGSVDGTGSLEKTGSGSVAFNSPNNAFSGAVKVTAGTLGLGGQTGPVTVATGATLIPRDTLRPQAASTISGTLAIRYDTATSVAPGSIQTEGILTLAPTSILDISGSGPLTSAIHIIAGGTGGVSGSFGTVNGVPAGYTLTYNHNNGSGFPVIALVSNTMSPYDTWAGSFGLSGASAGAQADPDQDGLKNLLEFALGSDPTQSTAAPALGRNGDFLTLTFNHAAQPGLVFSIEAGDSLAGPWSTARTYPAFTTAGSEIYTDTVAVGSTPRRFIRLSVALAN